MNAESSFSTAGASGILNAIFKRTDIAFALGLITILVIMIMPMPSSIMDFALAISIAFSVMILMTTLFIEKPLEFSSFPTILLVSTMIRLALNIASTRLILSHGHEGTHAAGRVIQAFGNLVMDGNFIIGLIVFAILVIVNFVVITKGSGRIAEVSARFSLDAMPGKQMAVDADLSAGLIDETQAKLRRKFLEAESNFYGSMDGSAKFVRGDAIAGLLITFINIIGGVIIGVMQNDMSFLDASRTYTLLTVGDGLVTQIPALIVSTAAGMLVSKAGVEGTTDKALVTQLGNYPSALGMSSFLMSSMSLLPGMPMIPFLALGGVTGYAAWRMTQTQQQIKDNIKKKEQEDTAAPIPEDSPASSLHIDVIRLEVGYGLVSLVNNEHGKKLTDQIKVLRKQLAADIGLLLPTVRVQDNLQLGANSYVIRIKELEAGRGELRANHVLVMDSHGGVIPFHGEETREPAFGLMAKWVHETHRDQAETQGFTVVDPATVLTTHLTELVKDNINELLSFEEVQRLIDTLPESYKKLLNDMVPNQITLGGIQRVLQNLVSERISIRDLPTILEAISEGCSFSRNTSLITEHVRLRLGRQITFGFANEEGVLSIVTLSDEMENNFLSALQGEGEIKQIAMHPAKMQTFIELIQSAYERFNLMGENPILVVNPNLRPYVRSVIERIRPTTMVMSQMEIHQKAKIKNLGTL